MVEGLFEMHFACDVLKLMSDRKTGCFPLNAENNRRVTNEVMFTYAHENINSLFSVLRFGFVLFYDCNLNTQGFV